MLAHHYLTHSFCLGKGLGWGLQSPALATPPPSGPADNQATAGWF